MNDITFTFVIDGTEWKAPHLERMAYERNLHMLHGMKRHGLEIKDGERMLSDDEIDYLTAEKAWEVSVETRRQYTGRQLMELYGDSFARSDAMWKELAFGQDKPMKVSYCTMKAEGISMEEFMKIFRLMQTDENVTFMAHPEHLAGIVTEKEIIGIEPFGTYGTPTLCRVSVCGIEELGAQIRADRDPSYPIAMGGRAYLTDGVTEINSPFHQLKPTKDGFEGKLAVYWPAGVVDEIVEGHSLHLAMEFYEGLKFVAKQRQAQEK
ncbi:MAG: hypothetical protein Q4C82_06470 [Eubacteriales bacterium]|nr:hypothetical protein [Eubacteriales bacterium]